ncbi:MAG: hypothetical protein FJ083_12690 [Cyanobacteria bacterium K_Offshore_surface_m2_239]|nr:hypothetical protein [Cyanobacteria bacterium K_Offshore_surface_m2_239]
MSVLLAALPHTAAGILAMGISIIKFISVVGLNRLICHPLVAGWVAGLTCLVLAFFIISITAKYRRKMG